MTICNDTLHCGSDFIRRYVAAVLCFILYYENLSGGDTENADHNRWNGEVQSSG